MPVIDASVYVALMNTGETAHATSFASFRRMVEEGAAITAPCIVLTEVAAALGRGLGDPALALQAVETLEQSRIITLIAGLAIACRTGRADRGSNIALQGCDAYLRGVRATDRRRPGDARSATTGARWRRYRPHPPTAMTSLFTTKERRNEDFFVH